MTTGAQPGAPPEPADFQVLQQPWARASNATVFEFSAVCWFYARRLVDTWISAGVAPIPLGLISDNIGGTSIALWSDNETLTACGSSDLLPAAPNPNPVDGALYASLIRPLTTGPTLFTSWIWFQAEADAPPYGWHPEWYSCMITHLVPAWRAAMGTDFWFGFTQLAPFWGTMDWSDGADGWQEIRQAQLAALALPSVAFASAVDIGDPQAPLGSYHPRNKQAIGERLGDAALAMVYGDTARRWRSPQLRGAATVSQDGSVVSVHATFDFVAGGLALTNTSCPTDLGVDPRVCGGFAVYATPGDGAPAPVWAYLGGGFLGGAGSPCGAVANHTIASAQAACDALLPGTPSCPQGCKGFSFASNTSDPGVPVPTTLSSVLAFFPETGRSVNYQSYGSNVDFRGAKLAGVNVTLGADGSSLDFSAVTTRAGQRAIAASYAWATWPVSTVENSDGLPLIPWWSAVAADTPVCRDAKEWPFNASSIWNTAIGDAATLVPAHLFDPADIRGDGARAFWNFHSDDDYFFVTLASDPLVPWYNQGHWGGPASATAYCNTTGSLVQQLRFPADATVEMWGNNNAAALLQPDGDTLVLTQPLYVCSPGAPVLSILDRAHGTASIRGDGALGGHGGSGLSALGGAVRRGELARGAPPIAHALKLELFAHWWYYRPLNGSREDCFSWPAIACDGYFNSCATDKGCYNGTEPNVRPGALLAIGATDAAALNASLATEPARAILRALATFGGYLVDDTYWNATAICTEHGVADDFAVEWGFNFTVTAGDVTPGARAWYGDLLAIFRALSVVTSNAPDAPGGGGVPLAPPPPPFCN